MEIFILKTAEEASRIAGRFVNEAIKKNPKTVLGLATGSTPLMLYKEMYTACQAGLDYSQVRSFNLDEYYGLDPQHPQSYRRFMNENLFNHLNIDIKNTRVPDGLAKDCAAACAQYEADMKAAGGVDIQVLGIGSDGHIGFNEPGSSLVSRTRLVTLTPQTDGDGVQTLEISATGGGGGGGSAWTHISTLSSHYKQSSAAYVNVYFYFNPLGPTVRSILIPYAHFSYSKNVTAKIAVWKCGAFNGGVSLGTPIAAKTFTQAIKHPLTWFDFDADVDVSDKTANYIFGYSTNSPDNGYVRIICDDSSADNNFGLVSYQMKSNNSWDSSYPLWYGGKQSMAFGLSSAAQNS